MNSTCDRVAAIGRCEAPGFFTGTKVLLLRWLLLPLLCLACVCTQAEVESGAGNDAELPEVRIMPAPFPIDVDGNLGELALDVEAGFTGADAYVTFLSEEEASVRCEILFRNGPEQRRRRVRLSPGVPRLVTAGLRRNVVRLRINLTCDRE